jgi:hypothetical protein
MVLQYTDTQVTRRKFEPSPPHQRKEYMKSHISFVDVMILFILLVLVGLGVAQCQQASATNTITVGQTSDPKPTLIVSEVDGTFSGSLQVYTQQWMITMPSNGPETLIFLDHDSKVVLTVYKDGHVVADDQTKMDKVTVAFWQALAKAYTCPKETKP